ncbi:ABC transporter substrate-binding protein [Muribaculum caecicola]|uniref:Iron ABC transporter substrate-binding protein n=2 Tax=Muribaculum TaxID=1918540 RepID=A0AC61S6H7_9BACT|nr:ABC transporter substrate-binding protein [Muribaculum caecicola]THG54249.1 iron ABC transporter substrate-binding protein [Muribaculum caecicola]
MIWNKYMFVFVGIVAVVCAGGCGSPGHVREDYAGEVVYEPEHASGFKIFGSDSANSVIIRSYDPWQGAGGVATDLFVRRGGEEVPAGFTGQVVNGNAERIVAMSSTHVAMLDAVGKVSSVVGVSGIGFISNPYIVARRDVIADIGFDGNIDYEALLSLKPDVVLLYGVNGASAMEGKLKELGIPFMYVGDYVEESPVGKAEWLVALAELTGTRNTGVAQIKKISASYDSLKNEVKKCVVKGAPKVLVNTPYSDQWFMPSKNSYIVRLISDAGGEYMYEKNEGNSSVPISIEDAFLLAGQADVWINTGTAASMAEIERDCPRFMKTNCVRLGAVYNNNLRSTPAGGNDMFESGTVNPDLVLRDLVKIFNPRLVPDSVPFVYYRKLE